MIIGYQVCADWRSLSISRERCKCQRNGHCMLILEISSLDLSFNLLRKVPKKQLENMKKLKMLYFIQNKISKIEGLEAIAGTLESVEFGGNKLRVRIAH